MSSITTALQALFDAYLTQYQQQHGHLPLTEYDEEWRSSCQQSEPNGWQEIHWQPVTQSPALAFSDLEHALDCTLHDDFKQYFSYAWSENLDVLYQHNKPLQLLLLWNEADYDRLKENLIGHWLSKQRLKQSPTLFFAVIDDERFISLDNQTGAIVLEQIGRKPEPLADNLLTFLQQLSPNLTPSNAG